MKRLLIIIASVLFTGTVQAQFRPAEITMSDGSKIEGFAEAPDFRDRNVKFKASENDRAQNIRSRDIKTIAFKDGIAPEEMDYLNCMFVETIVGTAGWGWATVVVRGAVSVYKGKTPQPTQANPDVLYCHREGEKHAIIPPILTFANAMAKYFADYPELSAKIKDRAAGYRGENIEAIIAEYNEWKERQQNL